jgi:uncharacterized membrane protein YphA (DoxX/SURF4 family)
MEKVYAFGRVVFSLAIIALGVEHFVCAHVPGDAVPVIPWEPARPLWAYLTGGVLIAAGLAIAWGVKPRLAAIVLGVLFLAAAFLQQLPQAWRLPLDIAQRTVFLEPLALGSAAFTLAAQLPAERRHRASPALERVLLWGRYVFAASAVVFGVDHLLIPQFIASLIPPWFPGALFWAYFTGVALIAAGASIATGFLDRWAAASLGAMFLVWFLFLHIPRLSSPPRSHDPDEWSSALIALGMCGASWLMVRPERTLKKAAQPDA